MPSKRHRRRNAHEGWEPSETDESFTSGHEHTRNIPNDTGGTSQYIDTQGYSFASNQADEGRSSEVNGNHAPQLLQKSTLESCTLAMDATMKSLQQTQDHINNMQKLFKQNVNELKSADETSRTLRKLEEDCKQKDDDLAKCDVVIDNLTSRQTKQRDEVEHEKEQLQKERSELKHAKEKQEKRIQAELAEEKKKIELQYEKRMTQYDEAEKKRKQELETEFTQKQLAIKKRETEFEAEKNSLSSAVKERDRLIKTQAEELEKVKEDYEILRRAMDSFKNEKSTLEAKLNAMKKEFALDPRPLEYFEKGFAKICHQIQEISGKYFRGIEGKEMNQLDQIHRQLQEADPLFEFVPIYDSDSSRDLCKAHAQRIMSQAICEDIWQQFSSDFTTSQPELSNILGKISHEIEQSDHGGRAAQFWNSLTERALMSLPAAPTCSRESEPTGGSYPPRTDKVISKVFILSPLVSPSQRNSLRMDLVNLVNLAVEVWNKARIGGLKLAVSLSLDYANREEWRSEEFDPVCEEDGTTTDLKTRKIFALYPQVLVAEQVKVTDSGTGIPGSFPEDLNRTTELTVIHTGKGLPEWSPLVASGMREQKEKEDAYAESLKEAQKLYQNKLASGSNRRNSRASGSPISPTEQWGKGRGHDFQ